MTRNAVWPSARSVGGLTVYAVVLLGLAYPCASAEHGLILPWMLFFAPLTAASRWVSWDGPIVPVLVTFFGVAVVWPLAGLVLRYAPPGSRRGIAIAGLVLHYVAGITLVATSFSRSQLAVLGHTMMATLVTIAVVAYLAGQVLIWRGIGKLQAIGGRVEGGTAAGPPGRVHSSAEKRM